MKFFYYLICLFFIGFTMASSAQASSIIFNPSVVTVTAGKTFNLPIVIDPAGQPQYTVRLVISFPPDLLEITSFVFNSNWISLSQPGYDSLNNVSGELIKTAGFPKGFSSPILLGTITLRAKKSGESVIVVEPKSFVLNEENTSTLEFRPQVRIIAGQLPPLNEADIKPLPNLEIEEQNLFDVNLEPTSVENAKLDTTGAGLTIKVAPGELLPILIKLTNFGGEQRVDVTLTYRIINQNGDVAVTSTETVAVETTASFTKIMQIPQDVKPGKYTAETSINYSGQNVPAVSSYQFTVERKIVGIFLTDLITHGIFTLFVGLLIAFISSLLIKKRKASRLTPYDYSKVPKDERIFYEIISDIIMQMRYRLGDKAVDIAKNINGLSVEDNGRVININKRSASIVALLIAKYENLLGQKVSFSFKKINAKTKINYSRTNKNLLVIRKR